MPGELFSGFGEILTIFTHTAIVMAIVKWSAGLLTLQKNSESLLFGTQQCTACSRQLESRGETSGQSFCLQGGMQEERIETATNCWVVLKNVLKLQNKTLVWADAEDLLHQDKLASMFRLVKTGRVILAALRRHNLLGTQQNSHPNLVICQRLAKRPIRCWAVRNVARHGTLSAAVCRRCKIFIR